MGVDRSAAATVGQFDDSRAVRPGGTGHRAGGSARADRRNTGPHSGIWPVMAAMNDSMGRMGFLVIVPLVPVWGDQSWGTGAWQPRPRRARAEAECHRPARRRAPALNRARALTADAPPDPAQPQRADQASDGHRLAHRRSVKPTGAWRCPVPLARGVVIQRGCATAARSRPLRPLRLGCICAPPQWSACGRRMPRPRKNEGR